MKKGYIIATFSIAGISVDWKQSCFIEIPLYGLPFGRKTERENNELQYISTSICCLYPVMLFDADRQCMFLVFGFAFAKRRDDEVAFKRG